MHTTLKQPQALTNKIASERGFSVLVLVLIIGASALIMAKGATWLSLRELDMGINSSIGKKATYIAEACSNEALLRLHENSSFSTSSQRLTLGNCSCSYSISASASQRDITATGTCENYEIAIKVTADTQNNLSLEKWEFN